MKRHGLSEEDLFQPSLTGLSFHLSLTRQSLPGYFHTRLTALNIFVDLYKLKGDRPDSSG